MNGYTPLFSSLTTGSLCGKWPDIGLWPIVLSLADRQGIVDVTPAYLASVTGLPTDTVMACMQRFCEPDPHSRSGELNGVRLVLIDERRDWGWRIVNHGKYREKARKHMQQVDATKSGRDADRKRVANERRLTPSGEVENSPAVSGEVQRSPAVSGDVRLSDSDSDSDSDLDERGEERPAASPAAKRDVQGRVVDRGAKGVRLSDDWKPSVCDLVLPDNFDIDGEAAKFRDYWRSLPGARGVKTDWMATWRNWVRRAIDEGRYAKRGNHSPSPTATFSGGRFQ